MTVGNLVERVRIGRAELEVSIAGDGLLPSASGGGCCCSSSSSCIKRSK